MDTLDSAHVEELTRELDELVPESGALLEIQDVVRSDSEGFVLRGNRLGFLRLGIECLDSGLREGKADPYDQYESLRCLYTRGHDSIVEISRQDNISIEEELPELTPEEERRRYLRDNIVSYSISAVILSCILLGAYTIVMWFVGLF